MCLVGPGSLEGRSGGLWGVVFAEGLAEGFW